MVCHNPKQRQFQLRSALVVAALAAVGCGGDTQITNTNPTASDPAVMCAQNPGAAACTPPANGNASTILVMVQPVGGKPGSAAATPAVTPPTTPPPAGANPIPTFPRAAGAAAPGASFPSTATGMTGAPAAGAAAPAMPAAGAATPSGTAGAAAPGTSLAGIPTEELDKLRQTCVDEINMYRATLTMAALKPMKRASAAQEDCSDKGAQMDGDSMQAHGAAKNRLCSPVGLFAENTCPGYPVGGRSGAATIADALKGCLKQMWAEGEPPVSRADCQKDYQGCFLKYGHYLNMSDPGNLVASCGFYKMKNGAYWMNQDFAAR